MAETSFRGPLASLGPMIGNVAIQAGTQVALVESTDGPAIFYQGSCFPDVRFAPFDKSGMNVGRCPGFLANPAVVMVDAVPSQLSTAGIAALANVATGVAMTLVTVAPGGGNPGTCSLVPATPLVPFGASAAISVMGLDMGFTTGTTVAGAAAVTVVDASLFNVGQWVVIGGAGNVGKTLPLVAQVTEVTDTTHIKVSPTPAGSLTNAPFSSANAYMSIAGNFPGTRIANAVQPYLAAGVARLWNPAEAVARNVRITAAAGAGGGAFTVKGYDVFGNAMTETITAAGGPSTAVGVKAFKYIASVTPGFTEAQNYSVGTGDAFGLPFRSDRWESLRVAYNAAFVTAATGWVQALQASASPSTATTADVRGTYGVQSASDGAKRLMIRMTVPLWNLTAATPSNAVPLFGYAQA